MRWILLFCESTVLRPRKEAMTITHHARGELLGKALIMFVGLLLVSLLIIFAIEPSIYTTTLWPVLLFLDDPDLSASRCLGNGKEKSGTSESSCTNGTGTD